MSEYHFKKWPFPEDATVALYWVTSPKINYWSGAKISKAYFQSEEGKVLPVEMQWGMIPELWIGRFFQNGVPAENEEVVGAIGTIDIDAIEAPQIMLAADAIPKWLYPLFQIRNLCVEYCVSFQYEGQRYMVPCVELTRAFYAGNSILANQLISSGGLDELIVMDSWNKDGRKVEFDFSEQYKAKATKNFARIFAMLYSVPELKQGWESTHVSYVKNSKICTSIPKIHGMGLTYCGIEQDGYTLITKIQQIQMPMPFDEVSYGPEALRASDGESKIKGHIPQKEFPDDVEIGDAEATAKLGQGVTLQAGEDRFVFLDEIHVFRKKGDVSSDSKPCCIKAGVENNSYSTNEQVGCGELPFANMDASKKVNIQSDPDFSLFCEALERLAQFNAVNLLDVDYGIVPWGKDVSYLEGGAAPRRYACAELLVAKKRWIIIELCLKDGYSLSTLFIRTDADKKELAKQMLGKLVDANGHWCKECFNRGITYRKLDHHKDRTARRWAELMYYKMH